MKHILLVLLLGANATAAEHLVVGVKDGDTVMVRVEGTPTRECRMYGIDAPEKAQAFGAKSKQTLAELIYGRMVDVQVVGDGGYGRSLCKIRLGALDVNREQVRRGMAWWYRKYAPLEVGYGADENAARSARMGLWSDQLQPVEPWRFRSNTRAAQSF